MTMDKTRTFYENYMLCKKDFDEVAKQCTARYVDLNKLHRALRRVRSHCEDLIYMTQAAQSVVFQDFEETATNAETEANK